MTLDLAKLRAETLALIDGTTPGPWRKGQEGNTRVYGPDGMGAHSGLIASFCRCADVRLVAAAPTLAADTLRLLDEIERLVAENERMREALSSTVCYGCDQRIGSPQPRGYVCVSCSNKRALLTPAALPEGGPDDR